MPPEETPLTPPTPTPETTPQTPEPPSLLGDAGKLPVDPAATPEPKPEDKPVVEKTAEEKAAEAKAAADKAADDTKATPFKTDEIKFSEGVEVDPALAEDFTKVVNEHGIPRSAVQALLGLQEKSMKAASEAGSALWTKTQDTWRNEIHSDPEIGGEKWKAHSTNIGKLLDEYGTPELRGALDLTGAGNHPAVARFMAKVAAHLTEPGAVLASVPSTGPRDAANILYPNQGKT